MAVGALACSCTNEKVIIVLFNMCTKETECMLIIGNFILMVDKEATSKQKELTVGADHFPDFVGEMKMTFFKDPRQWSMRSWKSCNLNGREFSPRDQMHRVVQQIVILLNSYFFGIFLHFITSF